MERGIPASGALTGTPSLPNGPGRPAELAPQQHATTPSDALPTSCHGAEAVRTALAHLAEQMPAAQLLQTVPGIGVLTATALVAFVGDIHRFRSGRHFAAYLGLTPRERPSGTVRRLGATPKQGNSYLRMLLIHGARAALRAGSVTRSPDDLRAWATAVAARQCHNVAAVALAKKLARVCWRVWRDGRPFARRDPH